MTIDWQKEVEARKEDLLEDLKNLLRVNSERDDSKVTRCTIWTWTSRRIETYVSLWRT